MLTKRQMERTEALCTEYIERKAAVYTRYQLEADPDDTKPAPGRETAALRRTSMELTRALAVLRGPARKDDAADEEQDHEQNDEPEADQGPRTPAPKPRTQPRRGTASPPRPSGRPTEIRCEVCSQMEPVASTGRVPTMCRQCRRASPADRELLRKAAGTPIPPPCRRRRG